MPTTNEYTGLILLSGADARGIAAGLFEVLSPFAITIHDVEEISIRGRTVLTVLIGLNINHTAAIEADLVEFSNSKSLDLAIDFAEIPKATIEPFRVGARVTIQQELIKAADLAAITSAISAVGGNIISINRLPSSGTLALELVVAGADTPTVKAALSAFATNLTVENFS